MSLFVYLHLLCVHYNYLHKESDLTHKNSRLYTYISMTFRIKDWENAQITKFTEEDSLSAMKKLEEAAFKWDHTNYIACLYINGFEAYLTPFMFKRQIDNSFGIRLTGAEVSFDVL